MIRISIDELNDPAEIARICSELDEPLFVTKDDHVEFVAMSPEVYEKLFGVLGDLDNSEDPPT